MAELKEKSLSSLAKRRRNKGGGPRGQGGDRGEDKAGAADAAQKGIGAAAKEETEREEVDYKEMVKGGKVIYIDTEGTFRPERIAQIAEHRGISAQAASESIIYARCFRAGQLNTLIIDAAALTVEDEDGFALIFFVQECADKEAVRWHGKVGAERKVIERYNAGGVGFRDRVPVWEALYSFFCYLQVTDIPLHLHFNHKQQRADSHKNVPHLGCRGYIIGHEPVAERGEARLFS